MFISMFPQPLHPILLLLVCYIIFCERISLSGFFFDDFFKGVSLDYLEEDMYYYDRSNNIMGSVLEFFFPYLLFYVGAEGGDDNANDCLLLHTRCETIDGVYKKMPISLFYL
jgi:hypothetical protein